MSWFPERLERSDGQLTPLEWVVLEDVALDATDDGDGRLVAACWAPR